MQERYIIYPGITVHVRSLNVQRWDEYQTEERLTFSHGEKSGSDELLFTNGGSQLRAKMVNVYGSWRLDRWWELKEAMRIEEDQDKMAVRKDSFASRVAR